MKRTALLKKISAVLLTGVLCATALAGCGSAQNTSGQSDSESAGASDASKITFALDWTPNTNHTGVYVAESMGYFDEAGLDVEIVQPSADGAEMMVGAGQAQFGVSFQDTMSSLLAGGEKSAPITAVAAIIQHNTSGIMSRQGEGITSPKGMEGKSYATWEWDIEQNIIRECVEADGGDYDKIEMIPETIDNEVAALKANQIDCIWVYYAWAGISARVADYAIDYFAFRDIDEAFDYYSPVIIANDDFLEDHPEEAKAFLEAVSRGYEYAIEHPEEAGAILISANPELDADLVMESQQYLADQYQAEAAQWGVMDADRWNRFYNWINEKQLYEEAIPENAGFTNDYLPAGN